MPGDSCRVVSCMPRANRRIVREPAPSEPFMLMSAAEYRESLRRLRPLVYVEGRRVDHVADEPSLAPGVNAIALTYDLALRESTQALMRADVPERADPINRLIAVPRTTADLLNKLEAVRLVCQE